MKKQSNWKRVLALGLSIVMTVSMAACGDKNKGGDKQNGGGSDPVANQQMAKEYVYHSTAVNFPVKGDGDVNVMSSRRNGDLVEILASSYDYSVGDNQVLTLHTMKADGTVVSSVDFEAAYIAQTPVDGEGPKGEPEENLEGPIDILPVDEDDFYDDDYYDEDYTYESSNYSYAIISENNVFALCYHYKDSYVGGEYSNENEESIACWDKTGKLLWKTQIDMSQYQNDDEYSYVTALVPMADNSVGMILTGSQNGVIQVTADGKTSGLKKSNSDKDVFSNEPYFGMKGDGTLLVSYYNEDYSKQYITVYDPQKDSFGEEYEVPQTARYNGFYNFAAGVNYDVIYSNSDGVFGFNLGDNEVSKVMDYVNSDMATYGLNNIVCIDENSFVATYYDPVDYSNQFGLFTYVKPEDIKDKKTLLYAGCYIGYDLKTNIIRFNKESDEYRITIKDYSIYNTDEDYTQGYTKLNNDIIAGNIPDILLLSNEIPVDSFIAKGIFANIDELIKNDEELSKQEYMENVFDAYRVNGVLYRVIPKFNIHTWVGKKSLVGERTGWTMDEVKQAASKLTGKKEIFGSSYSANTRDQFLITMLNYCGRDFIDVNTGKCNFNTKLFADLLEYAKTLPSEEQASSYDEEYWEAYWEEYYSQYRENHAMLMEMTMYDLSSLNYQIHGMIGEEVSYVGFPTESGAGSFIDAEYSYAIFAKSANKEGAWQFLRRFLTEDYQENKDYKYGYDSGIPVLKKLVQAQANKLMERPYWEDENGNKNYYDDTFWINGESIIIDQFTQSEVDSLMNFVNGVNKTGYYDEDVLKIVSEEAGSFFSGSKSAMDVANMIQNRVQLYVNENK